jgi:hypothetical protein
MPHNNGMHPTANSAAFIINHPARRSAERQAVMPLDTDILRR